LALLIAVAAVTRGNQAEDVIRRSQAAISGVKADLLIQLRDSPKPELTLQELAASVGISQEIVGAVLNDMAGDGQIECDEDTHNWRMPTPRQPKPPANATDPSKKPLQPT
jgi:hypothetical protein